MGTRKRFLEMLGFDAEPKDLPAQMPQFGSQSERGGGQGVGEVN